MNQFNVKAIRSFIDGSDRKEPLFFMGRFDEKDIAQAVFNQLEDGRTEGNTVIFQGAPGAGKTALLNHLKDTVSSTTFDTARLSSHLLHQPSEALFEVFEQVEPKLAEDVLRQKQTEWGIKIFGVNRQSTSKTAPIEIPTVRQLMNLRQSRKPLILFLDEAQNSNGDLPDGKSSILQELHSGHSGSVCLIIGGLSNTRRRIKSLGISRVSSDYTMTLQSLHEKEVIDALEAFLNYKTFKIDPRGCDLEPLKELVVDESMGWPQHLTNTLRSLGEELIRVEGKLSGCDMDRIQNRSQARREDYYADRLEGIPDTLLSEVVLVTPRSGSAMRRDIRKAVRVAYENDPDISEDVPKGEAFNTLIHHGVLQEDVGGNLTIPIPSMHDYVMNQTKAHRKTVETEVLSH